MNNKILSVFVALILSFVNSAWAGCCGEPTNLDFVKQRLVYYHDSGDYARDQARVAMGAMQYLRYRLTHSNPDEKLAVVFDIDETTLSNYPDMVRMRFGGTLAEIGAAQAQGIDPVIQPSLELYKYAKANHVAVFFVTGRTEALADATMKNLVAKGYRNWDGLIFKPSDYKLRSVIPYKSSARRDIEKRGYKIVLSIGDQVSDLEGGYVERGFKLPNPYYYLP